MAYFENPNVRAQARQESRLALRAAGRDLRASGYTVLVKPPEAADLAEGGPLPHSLFVRSTYDGPRVTVQPAGHLFKCAWPGDGRRMVTRIKGTAAAIAGQVVRADAAQRAREARHAAAEAAQLALEKEAEQLAGCPIPDGCKVRRAYDGTVQVQVYVSLDAAKAGPVLTALWGHH